MRPGAITVAVLMVLVAGSTGAVLHFALGVSAPAAGAIAAMMLTAFALYGVQAARAGAHGAIGGQLHDLARSDAELARQLAEASQRIAELESKIERTLGRTHAATDPLAAKVSELGGLVRQLSGKLSAQEEAFAALRREMGERAAAAVARPPRSAGIEPSSVREPEARTRPAPVIPPAEVPVPPVPDGGGALLAATVHAAVDAERIDLYLQPVVRLPQRDVCAYEALARLRSDDGTVLAAADFIGVAEGAGLMPRIDSAILFRCIQLARRYLLKDQGIQVFCNLASATLADDATFARLVELLDANTALAPTIVFELTQRALRSVGRIEGDRLAALSARGFRFSVDNVTDRFLEPQTLANTGVRFVKVPANLLLDRTAPVGDLRPNQLAELLGRFGIDLIAEKIEEDATVMSLLDCDVRYGQGHLFSPPRALRAGALDENEETRGEDAGDPAHDTVVRSVATGAGNGTPEAAASEGSAEPRADRQASLSPRFDRI